MSRLVFMAGVVSLLLAAPARAQAVEYSLQVASLIEDGFAYFMRSPIGRGEGEGLLPQLPRSLDAGEVGWGALLYDRDVYPVGERVARSFGAVPTRPTGYSSSQEKGLWKTVRWEGKPGERVVWVIRPATSFWREVRHLGLDGTSGEMRYYIPYRVTISPKPSSAVAYSLPLLRTGEEGTPLWDRFLSPAVDLREGLAAVIGVSGNSSDWVYLVVEEPSEPTVFRAAIGWARRGSHDEVQAGTGGGVGARGRR